MTEQSGERTMHDRVIAYAGVTDRDQAPVFCTECEPSLDGDVVPIPASSVESDSHLTCTLCKSAIDSKSGKVSTSIIEVSEKTRKRYDEKKAEMDAADPNLPDMTDDQFMKCLLDTLEAVENDYYAENYEER